MADNKNIQQVQISVDDLIAQLHFDVTNIQGSNQALQNSTTKLLQQVSQDVVQYENLLRLAAQPDPQTAAHLQEITELKNNLAKMQTDLSHSDQVTQQLQAQVQQFNKNIHDADAKQQTLVAENQQLQQSQKDLVQQKAQLEQQNQALKNQLAPLEQEQKRLADLNDQLKNDNQTLHQNMKTVQDQLGHLQQEQQQLTTANDQLRNEIKAIKPQLDTLSQEKANLENQNQTLQQDMKNAQDQLTPLQQARQQLTTANDQLRNEIKAIQTQHATAVADGQTLANVNASYQQEISSAMTTLQQLQESLRDLQQVTNETKNMAEGFASTIDFYMQYPYLLKLRAEYLKDGKPANFLQWANNKLNQTSAELSALLNQVNNGSVLHQMIQQQLQKVSATLDLVNKNAASVLAMWKVGNPNPAV
jgi:chromosome segregation ATPase